MFIKSFPYDMDEPKFVNNPEAAKTPKVMSNITVRIKATLYRFRFFLYFLRCLLYPVSDTAVAYGLRGFRLILLNVLLL